jgi:hypothetical protein
MMAGLPVTAQSPPPAQLATPVLVRYEDPIGDTKDGLGPDIVAVTLAAPDPGSLSIGIEFTTDPPLTYSMEEGWTDMLMILGSTQPAGVVPLPGEDQGVDADFATGLHGATLEEDATQGAPLNVGEQIRRDGVAVSVDGTTVTLTLTRESLGDPERIVFFMGTFREGLFGEEGTSGGDVFPDASEEGRYTQVAWTFPTP